MLRLLRKEFEKLNVLFCGFFIGVNISFLFVVGELLFLLFWLNLKKLLLILFCSSFFFKLSEKLLSFSSRKLKLNFFFYVEFK